MQAIASKLLSVFHAVVIVALCMSVFIIMVVLVIVYVMTLLIIEEWHYRIN